jgi:hypothetical protein
MTKPSVFPTFDSNETNVVATLAGHITDGYADDEIPTAAEFNYMLNLIGKWIEWTARSERTKTISPFHGKVNPDGTPDQWDFVIGASDQYVVSTGIGQYYVPLDLEVGNRPRDILLNMYGDAAAGVTIVAYRRNSDGTVTNLAQISSLVPAAAWANARINFAADTGAGALTIDVVAAGPTFTRTGGSFITDGFCIGMTIATTGFTNAGNNTTKVISAVTATVITVSSGAGLVNESGSGNERVICTPPTVAIGESYHLQFGTSAANIRFGGGSMSYDDGSVI